MPDSGFLAVFLVGLLGGVHCAGMCGGIVSALALQMPGKSAAGGAAWTIHLAYNLGRIGSYAVAGALMGALGSLGLLLDKALPVQLALYVAANLMMVALGLYLTGISGALAFTERAGQWLWRRIQPARQPGGLGCPAGIAPACRQRAVGALVRTGASAIRRGR